MSDNIYLSRTFSRDLREFALKSGESRRDLTHFVMVAEAKEEEIALLRSRIEVLEARSPSSQPKIPALTPTPIQPEPNPVAERFVICPDCGGAGIVDSGGVDSRDYPINIACPLCRGKPVTDAQVRAAGWVPADEKPPPKEHNPHGLVAFYTDAPVKPWGNTEGRVDHPKGCACGLCEQEDEDTHS